MKAVWLNKNELLSRINSVKLDGKKIAAIILVSAAVLYIDFSSLLASQLKGFGLIGPKIAKLKSDISAVHKDLAAFEKARVSGAGAQTKQKAFLKVKRIISEEQIPLLLQNISETANRHGIRVMSIKPSRETKAKEEKSFSGVKFTPLLVMLDLSCGYHQFGAFLSDLENADDFYSVHNMEIAVNPGNYLQQNVSLVLKSYVKK